MIQVQHRHRHIVRSRVVADELADDRIRSPWPISCWIILAASLTAIAPRHGALVPAPQLEIGQRVMIGTLTLTLGPVPKISEPSSPGDARIAPAGGVRVEAESSFTLVRRAHDGDPTAVNELFVRYLPRLQRWAHGRLPSWARGAL